MKGSREEAMVSCSLGGPSSDTFKAGQATKGWVYCEKSKSRTSTLNQQLKTMQAKYWTP